MNNFTAPRRPAITQKWIFQKLLLQILNNWMWIAVFVIATVTVAFLINRYNSKIYRTSIQVVKGGTEYSEQEASYLFGGGMESSRINIKYERAFITSQPILEDVIEELELQVSYYSRGRVKTYERFGYVPIRLVFDPESKNIPYSVEFTIHSTDGKNYILSTENEKWNELVSGHQFEFGKNTDLNGFIFNLGLLGSLETGEWIFLIHPVESLAKRYQGSVAVSEVREGYSWSQSRNSMLELSMQSSLPFKDREFLNQLFIELRKADVVRKIEQSERTIDFIEDQLAQITDSMRIIAAQMRTLKLSNRELSSGSQAVFGKITNLEEEKTQLLIINKYCNYLENYIASSSNDDIIAPSIFGIENDMLGGLVKQYIDLQLEKRDIEDLGFNSSVFHKEILQKDRQTEEIEKLILTSIANTRQANQIKIDEYNEQIDILFLTARSVLSEEIVFADFERLYTLNEKVFTLLMDKKAEAGITQASMISDYRIFEQAKTSSIPLKPQTRRNYMTGLILGFLIPIGFLFLKTLNRNTILSLTELEELVNLPVAGVIGYSQNPRTMLDAPQSLVAENFRSLRSNLRFVNGEKEKTVFVVTSSVSAEGKTFISANLASSMALQGKRSIVVGADMRKPTLHNYFPQENETGLSQYLSGQAELEEVIQYGGAESLEVIFSGPVPPNPSELLAGKMMRKLIEELRSRYDIVFIDTPPIGLISDASEIFDQSDTILLVTRQQKTPVSTLQHADHFMDESSLRKSMLIFNGVRKGVGYGYYGYGYGYGYGQGYYKEERSGYRIRRKRG